MDDFTTIKEPVNTYIRTDSISCPSCNEKMVPKFEFGVTRVIDKQKKLFVLASCTDRDCKMPFLIEHELLKAEGSNPNSTVEYYHKSNLYEYGQWEDTPDEIEPYSDLVEKRPFFKIFVEIYCQAYTAEVEDLNHIAGMGYRKALEFLIKEYSSYLAPEKRDSIEKQSLSDVINTHLGEFSILKKTAKAATWLGNDQVHLIQKWPEKDVSDLKKLIMVTAHWMEQAELSKDYIKEMGL